jgi:hypothetical protein
MNMKKMTAILFFMTFSVMTCFSQDKQLTEKQKPKATYQVGTSKVTVWENKKPDGSTWKNFKIEKTYKKGDKWVSTNSFDQNELLELKAAIDKAISEESVREKSDNKK